MQQEKTQVVAKKNSGQIPKKLRVPAKKLRSGYKKLRFMDEPLVGHSHKSAQKSLPNGCSSTLSNKDENFSPL